MANLIIAPRKVAATATSSATLAKGYHTPVDATSGAKTMTLPSDAPAGVEISVEKVDASVNAVTVSGSLRGVASTIPLTTQYEARTFLSDGSGSWRPTSDHRTAASLSATYGRRRKYDVRDYLGNDDFGAAVNRAIAAAFADTYSYGKPGQVIMPPGNFPITTEITWLNGATTYHGVDLIGAGWGKTVLRPQARGAAIHHISPSGSASLRDVLIANFEIDGSDQSLGAGTYATSIKGAYMQRLRRVTLDHLYVHDVGATGIGNDFHDDCVIRDVLAVNCGRLNDGTGAGGAGIGIGTGVYAVEALLVDGCRTNDNKRAGLFFETQSGGLVLGVRVVGHVAQRNGEHGIGDAGCRGLTVTGGLSRRNVKSGFATYQATVSAATPGIKGRVSGLHSLDNGENGMHIDWSGRTPGASYQLFESDGSNPTYTPTDLGYTFDNVTTSGNGSHGVLIQGGGTAAPSVRVSNSDLSFNTKAGLAIVGAGTAVPDVSVIDSRVNSNGQSGSGPSRAGIYLGSDTLRLRLEGNRANDAQASKTQTYGLRVLTGTMHADAWINANDFRFNLTGVSDISGTIPVAATVGLNPGISATPGALIADSFNRADAATLGTPDGGRNTPVAWALFDAGTGGGWVVESKAARPLTGGTGNVTAYQDKAAAGGIYEYVMDRINGTPSGGFAFRVQDASNVFYIANRNSGGVSNAYTIQKRVAGANTAVAVSAVVPAPGDVIRVEDDGTSIKLYVNGVLATTASDAFAGTSTKFGLHGNATVDTFTRYQQVSYRAVV